MLYPLFTSLLALAGLIPVLAPHPPWGDGPEFIASAMVEGIVHPTGYPLYSLLTAFAVRFCTVLGAANPGVAGVHLVSALSMAAAAGLMCAICQTLGERLIPAETSRPPLFSVLGMAAGLTLAWGETAIEMGTTAEVYSLQLALQMAILLAALRIVSTTTAPPPPATRAEPWRLNLPEGRWILLGGLLCGLALAHHRMAAFACLAWGGALIVAWARALRTRAPGLGRLARRTLGAAALGGLGLAAYLYLPLRAGADPPLNWGAPDSGARFSWSVRGGEFVAYRLLQPTPGRRFTREEFASFARMRTQRIHAWMGDQLGDLREAQFRARRARDLVVGAFLVGGGCSLLALAPAAGGVWLIATLGYLALPFLYNIADIEGYMLALWGCLLLAIAVGVGLIWRLVEGLAVGRSMHFFPLLLLVFPMALYASEFPRSAVIAGLNGAEYEEKAAGQDPLTDAWPRRVFAALPPGAVVLTEGDNDYFLLHYAQSGVGLRPDVVIVGTNFLKEEWYARAFERPAGGDDYPPYRPKTGGGTVVGRDSESARRAFFDRIAEQAIEPARRQGRPLFFLTSQGEHLAEYARLGEVEPAATLMDRAERERMRFVLAPPPVALRRLR